jgi:hypothetical protein
MIISQKKQIPAPQKFICGDFLPFGETIFLK